MTLRVVLVRPWTDAHGGSGCCSGDARDGICLEGHLGRPPDGAPDGAPDGDTDDRGDHGHGRWHDGEAQIVAEAYLRLRAELPGVDVQIVSVGNTAYLLPSVFLAVRRRRGTLAALRETNRATTAGSVLVDGERLGDISALGVDGVLAEVRRRAAPVAG